MVRQQQNTLLRSYWRVPPRQMEVSVVFADKTWWKLNGNLSFGLGDTNQ